MKSDHPVLSLAELEAHDPGAPHRGRQRPFLCPLPTCGGKSPTPAHRSLKVNTETGAWLCHRCGARGRAREWWEERPRLAPRERQRLAVRQAFSGEETRPPSSGSVGELTSPPSPWG